MKLLGPLLALLALTTIARADIPPSNSEQCSGKTAGTACTLDEGGAGHCEETTCSRARRDGESTYACTLCVAGAPPSDTKTTAPKRGSCAAGGADTVLALGAAVTLLLRRRRA